MKLSTRGSIRKAPNAISWVFSLVNMASSSKSYDPAALIRAWCLSFESCQHRAVHFKNLSSRAADAEE